MKKKKLAVIGAGESGVGAALLGNKRGWDVFVSDFRQISSPFRQELENENIAFEEGQHSFDKMNESDQVVKSPGVPDHIPLINGLVRRGIEVISEIEFAYRYTQSRIIAITGSNGKTTTTNKPVGNEGVDRHEGR